jgi:hypothetical protein
LLLAALLLVLAPRTPDRSRDTRRNEIAVAAIVNLRAECGVGAREVFGQFLSSLRLSHRVPPGISLEELARDVHRETVRIKAGKLYLQTLVAVRLSGLVWPFLDDGRRRRLYTKTFPVWAGLTTLNVNALWTPNGGAAAPARYLRAVSTGPLAPLVVAATTSGTTLELALTYRVSADIAPEIDRIAEDLRRCLQSLR